MPWPPPVPRGHDTAWLQTALDNWALLARDILEVPAAKLPWMVLFDRNCVWHVAPDEDELKAAAPAAVTLQFGGQPVRVMLVPHNGKVTLPGGRQIARHRRRDQPVRPAQDILLLRDAGDLARRP